MENLTRLSLQKNFIDTEAITPLLYLEHLEILNLHSTQVDKNLFDLIKSMNSLKKCLYGILILPQIKLKIKKINLIQLRLLVI